MNCKEREGPDSFPLFFYLLMLVSCRMTMVSHPYASVRYPSGLWDCHLQESAHISSIPFSAFQPSSRSAFAQSE